MEHLIWSKILKDDPSGTDTESTSSSSTDDEVILYNQRENRAKIPDFVGTVIPAYSLIDFKSNFRLNRHSVQVLVAELNILQTESKVGPRQVLIETSILLTLWTLANQESFRGISDRFGISKGTCHTVFIRTCKQIASLKNTFIVWPTDEIAVRTVEDFNNLRGPGSFPGVIGCIAGSHIPIPGPRNDISYYNRKGFHSILLQGVCNANLEFIDIFCGWPGSSHDCRMWQNSPLCKKIAREPEIIPNEYHLLGDSSYGLQTYLMVPFKDNGHLSAAQKLYNRKLSSTGVVIEQAFGRLKNSYRILKYVTVIKLKYAKYAIMSACILHNIAVKEGVVSDSDISNDPDNDEPVVIEIVETRESQNKGLEIMNNLNEEIH